MAWPPHGVLMLVSGSCISLSRMLHSTYVLVLQGTAEANDGLVKATVSKTSSPAPPGLQALKSAVQQPA